MKRRNSTASAGDDINGGTKWGRFRVGAEVSIGSPSDVLAHPVISPVEGRGGDLIKLLSCSSLRDREDWTDNVEDKRVWECCETSAQCRLFKDAEGASESAARVPQAMGSPHCA